MDYNSVLVNMYPGIMPDTPLQQLHKTDRNPAQESDYQRMLSEAGVPFTVQNGKTVIGGGTTEAGGIPGFTFDWTAAEKEALEKLTPYYKAKLDEAEGDVNLAKTRIKDDYDRGVRYREEDLTTAKESEGRQKEQELQSTLTELNRRGILFGEQPAGTQESRAPYSDIAQRFFLDPLSKEQQARQQAIERAVTRQGEVAGIEKARGTEDIDREFPRYKRELEEEKKEKAVLQMAPLKYQQELSKYQATTRPALTQYP